MEIKRILEALLFASSKPMPEAELADCIRKGAQPDNPDHQHLLKTKPAEIREQLQHLSQHLNESGSPIQLHEIAGGWQLTTAPAYSPWVRQITGETRQGRLSPAALETLAVIAYRQPITRAGIEAVRGVAAGGVLETLTERGIIRVAGRADVPGKPLLYETTDLFLEHFGLRNLSELTDVEELKRIHIPAAPEQPQQELLHDATGTPSQN